MFLAAPIEQCASVMYELLPQPTKMFIWNPYSFNQSKRRVGAATKSVQYSSDTDRSEGDSEACSERSDDRVKIPSHSSGNPNAIYFSSSDRVGWRGIRLLDVSGRPIINSQVKLNVFELDNKPSCPPSPPPVYTCEMQKRDLDLRRSKKEAMRIIYMCNQLLKC